MKKIYTILTLIGLFYATSCSEDFIDTEILYEVAVDNFYDSPEEIEQAISGIYFAQYGSSAFGNELLISNILSDMMFGGGGTNDINVKNVDAFLDPTEDTYQEMWITSYNGIVRANTLIERVEALDFKTFFDTQAEADALKNKALGEAHFMRAIFYFKLAKFFGGVPLILKIDDARDVPRSSYSDTFAVIASDLQRAIGLLPATNITASDPSEYGHATKWAAEAYMARVYLFYTGYMTNIENQPTSDLPLIDGGSITKAQAISYLDDCIANSGHALLDDFRSLWPYSHLNQSAGTVVLPWADSEGLTWAGQDGPVTPHGTGNLETMFSVRYAFGDWTNGNARSNWAVLFQGIRGNPSFLPFGQGWGWCTVNTNLWDQWDDTDPRKEGSILEVNNPDQATDGYQGSKGDHETGFFNKKYTPLRHGGSEGEIGMFNYVYDITAGFGADFQLRHAQDFITMRYADVLLMHSELSETATGMNQVRARAGLPIIGYSLEALKEERLHEFSFEGLRWFDIVRWGDVNTAFDNETPVNNEDGPGTYRVNYRSEIKGLLPIAESEIRLSNGVYEQNPGW
ncbi:RagB/SusD family nutrient uptake outer membrane protein [Flavobacteriaceae bacterium MHTCC 0001]